MPYAACARARGLVADKAAMSGRSAGRPMRASARAASRPGEVSKRRHSSGFASSCRRSHGLIPHSTGPTRWASGSRAASASTALAAPARF